LFEKLQDLPLGDWSHGGVDAETKKLLPFSCPTIISKDHHHLLLFFL
jgi:hypothetical protein